MNNAKAFKTDKKNTFDLNKYLNSFNYNKKTTNKMNINSDRDYTTKNNTNFINSKKVLVNNNGNNNIILKNNLNSNNINNINNIYIRENTPSNDLRRTYNDKYFDSITINNNNSINFHEPKLYIYVENNNNNSNKIKNDNIKSYTNDNNGNNESKPIFKYEKNSKLKKINTINNAVEQTKKILNKRTTSDVLESNTKARVINRYGINKLNNNTMINDNYKINKSIALINDNNKKLLDLLRKKNASLHNNKNIYSSLNETMKNNINYNWKQNEMMIEPIIKNNRTTTNRSINSINNYTYNELDNNYINNSTHYNYILANDYPNTHNILKTDVNMDVWSYNKGRIEDENIFKNKYFIINNNPKINRGKNLNSINNYIIRPNNDIEMFNNMDNIDHKIKLQKMQKRKSNNIIDNNKNNNIKTVELENYNKNIVHKSINIGMNNIEDNSKIMNIINDNYNYNSPLNSQNNSNVKNYKKFVKQYNNVKM